MIVSKKSRPQEKKKKIKGPFHSNQARPIEFHLKSEVPSDRSPLLLEFMSTLLLKRLKANPQELIQASPPGSFGNSRNSDFKRTGKLFHDSRIDCLAPSFFKGKRCLDIGCKEGTLTLLIAESFQPSEIIGCDIDPFLIQKAETNLKLFEKSTRDSLGIAPFLKKTENEKTQEDVLNEKPHFAAKNQTKEEKCLETSESAKNSKSKGHGNSENDPQNEMMLESPRIKETKSSKSSSNTSQKQKTKGTFQNTQPQKSKKYQKITKNQMDLSPGEGEKEQKALESANTSQRIPISLLSKIKELPLSYLCQLGVPEGLITDGELKLGFSKDKEAVVSFRVENFIREIESERERDFDTIVCFGVTKWVHLNWGDTGIRRLFQKVFNKLKDGGLFLLEAQEWSSYKKHKKMSDLIKSNYEKIEIRPMMFLEHLVQVNDFEFVERIQPIGKNAKKRDIMVLMKPDFNKMEIEE